MWKTVIHCQKMVLEWDSYENKAVFHALKTKLHTISPSSGKCVCIMAIMTAYTQILLNTINTRFGNFAWKEGGHNSCKKFHFSSTNLIKALEMKLYLQNKIYLYTKTCCVRSFHKKKWAYWILCLIQTLRPQKIKK